MLFDSLDKIKRNAIFSSILLIALGAIILICPVEYIPTLILGFGYSLAVISIVMLLDFYSGKKSLMDYLKCFGAMILGFVGISVLVFRSDTMRVLAWLFGFLLFFDGLRTLIHSFTYARRAGRNAWWVLTILSVLMMIAGIVLFINPWFSTEIALMRAIGATVLCSALVSGLRLIWTWPVRKDKGGQENVE